MSLATALLIPGLVLLAAGLVAFFWPERAWRPLFPRRSRWQNQASTGGFLLFLGLGALGLALVALYTSALWQGWRSTRWVEVPGTVLASRLVETRQIRSTNPAYRAAVNYSFPWQGETRRGHRVDFADSSTGDRAAVEHALATRYAPGAPLTVWVEPTRGRRAVLDPGLPTQAAILTALGAVFLVVSGLQLRSLFRDWSGDNLMPSASPRRRAPRSR